MSQKFANTGSFIEREDLGKPNKGVDRVQKGFTAAYPTQSSIPYRHRRSVIPESEKRGFNSQARRFYSKKDDIPGPGFYNVIHQSPVFNSVSLSKRGTCTFPSTCARLGPVISKYPAANAYTIRSELASKKDFSNSCSSMFQLPTFIKVVKSETPAPNHYNASISICKQRNNVCARAGFLSKTPRGFVPSSEPGGPAPGHYDVNESLVRESPKVLVSCFKSKTGRGLKPTSTGPGPGYYNPNDQTKILRKSHLPSLSKPSVSWLTGVEKVDAGSQQGLGSQIFRTAFWHGIPLRRNVRKTTLLNFSAQPLPLPEKPPLPGPGQYEIVNYQGPPKHFISTASFVSNTSRWPVKSSKPTLPGPASYKPEIPGKQSFLYNEDNKWIPAV